jgi:hypothetical protein
MNEIVEQRGRFTLVHTDEGFSWTMAGPDGGSWYWHPGEAQWTACPVASPSAELASARLDLDATPAASHFRHPEAPEPARADARGSS